MMNRDVPRRIFLLKILVVLTACFHGTPSFAQSSAPLFYEIVKDDSVVMFFNKRYHFIEKACADFSRRIRVDNGGDFNGYFEDRSTGNVLLTKGNYIHGKKNGRFETYYPTGKLKFKGDYVNDIPLGKWEYFYENGSPERTLQISGSDTLLVSFVDRKGDLKVMDGNGDFDGSIAERGTATNVIIAMGKIENGKPHGKWTSTFGKDGAYCKELFDHGKLIKGSFPNGSPSENARYGQSRLNRLFLNSYLMSLESFAIETCADSARYVRKKTFLLMYRDSIQTCASKLIRL